MPLSSLPAPTDTSFSGTQTSQPHSNEPRPSIAPSRSTFGSSHSASARLTSASIDPGPPRPANQPKVVKRLDSHSSWRKGSRGAQTPEFRILMGRGGPESVRAVDTSRTPCGHFADTSETAALHGKQRSRRDPPRRRTAVPTFSRIGATTRQAPTALDEKRWCISRQPGERLATPSPRPEFESQ